MRPGEKDNNLKTRDSCQGQIFFTGLGTSEI